MPAIYIGQYLLASVGDGEPGPQGPQGWQGIQGATNVTGIQSVEVLPPAPGDTALRIHLVNDEETNEIAGYSVYGYIEELGWQPLGDFFDETDTIEPVQGPGAIVELNVKVTKSITTSSVMGFQGIQFVNDVDTPGYFQVYAYDDTDKGWKDLGSMFTETNTTEVTHESTGAAVNVKVQKSINIGVSGIQFVNDETTPGNRYFYGTDSGGVRGWHPLSQKTFVTHVQLTANNQLQTKTQDVWIYDPSMISGWNGVSGWAVTACSATGATGV